jgi:hypothetical protein
MILIKSYTIKNSMNRFNEIILYYLFLVLSMLLCLTVVSSMILVIIIDVI